MLFDRKTGEHRSATAAWDRSRRQLRRGRPIRRRSTSTAENQGRSDIFRLQLSGGDPLPILTPGDERRPAGLARRQDARLQRRPRSTAPAEIFTAPLNGAEGQVLTGVTRITHANPGLAAFKLRAGRERDATRAPAARRSRRGSSKPPDFREGQKYPLLYLVHGGPQSAWHDGWTYRWNAQVFASAGYVVFMPNPRGSTGFGQQFTDEISGDWGGKVVRRPDEGRRLRRDAALRRQGRGRARRAPRTAAT